MPIFITSMLILIGGTFGLSALISLIFGPPKIAKKWQHPFIDKDKKPKF